MINFEKHIKDSLYEYDFFIVPGLGAFIASFRQASLTEDGKLLEPQKTFEFNSLLHEDADNKFINYVQQKENLSPAVIAEELNHFLFRLDSSLNTNTRLVISQHISLARQGEGKIEAVVDPSMNFYRKPDFADAEPTGDFAFTSRTLEIPEEKAITEPEEPILYSEKQIVSRESEEQPQENVTENGSNYTWELPGESSGEDLQEEEEMYEEKSPFTVGKLLIYLIPLLLIGLALYYVLLRKPFKEKQQEVVVTEEIIITEPDTVEVNYVEEDSTAAAVDSLSRGSASDKLSGVSSFKPDTGPARSTYTFEVAAGLFKNRTNAEKLMERMKKAGFNAEVRIVSGMRRVYVGANTKEEAESLSQKIEKFTGEKSVYFDENGNSNK